MKGEKLTTPDRYRHRVRVTFDGMFPVDLLRYDRCYPASEESANKIRRSIEEYGSNTGRQSVYVEKCHEYADPMRAGVWTWSNWESYPGLEIACVEPWRNEDTDRTEAEVRERRLEERRS